MLMMILADVNNDGDDYWGHMGGWGGGWMWLWGIAMMVLFTVLIVWMVRAQSPGPTTHAAQPSDPSDRARAILAERFAKGELSTEEFQERADALR